MHDARAVGRIKALEDSFDDVNGLRGRELAKISQELPQGDSRQVLHHDEGDLPVLALVEDIHNIGVGEPCGLARFLDEPPGEMFVFGEVRVHDFHGNRAIKTIVQAAIDGCHTAAGDAIFNQVSLVDGATNQRVRRGGSHLLGLYSGECPNPPRRSGVRLAQFLEPGPGAGFPLCVGLGVGRALYLLGGDRE